jgi:hypothetical protein
MTEQGCVPTELYAALLRGLRDLDVTYDSPPDCFYDGLNITEEEWGPGDNGTATDEILWLLDDNGNLAYPNDTLPVQESAYGWVEARPSRNP